MPLAKPRFLTKNLLIVEVHEGQMCIRDSPQAEEEPPGEAPVLEEPEGPVAAKDLVARSKALDGFHYELVTTLPDGQRFTHKVWVEGENMRSEMENPGTNELMVALVNLAEDEVYLYQPDQKMAVKMKTSQSEVETATPQDYLGGYDLDVYKRQIFRFPGYSQTPTSLS